MMKEIDWKKEYEFLALALFSHIAILESLSSEGRISREEAEERKKITTSNYIKAVFRYRTLSPQLKYKTNI